jgi:prepilin-type N-terminal cleavage/methylation domain-containing protein
MRREQGFTLVELLVSLAITGLIFTVVGTTMFQLTTVSAYGNDKLTIAHEVQNIGYWFNLDGQMAVSANGGATLSFTLPASQTITYALDGKNLQRSDGTTTRVLAQNISAASFSVQNRLVTLNITSSISGRTDIIENTVFKVYLRPVLP